MPRKIINEHEAIEGRSIKKDFIANSLIRSEDVQDIINRNSSFVEKWALIIFLGILICLFGSTWFIRYPDIIQTRATLSAYNGPKELIPLQTGRLVRLFAQNGQLVKAGDMIGWIESTTKTSEALDLSIQLDNSIHLLALGKADKLSTLFNKHFQNLGSLQASFQTFSTALQQYNDYMVNGFYSRQKKMILSDISSLNNMDSALTNQKRLTEQDNELSRETYEMNEKLYKEKVITTEEYRQEKSKLVNKQMEIPQITSNILSNQNQQRDKLKELEQQEHDAALQKTTFEQALQTLKSNVDEWKRQYLLLAPLDGIIYFTMPLQQGQFVEQGKLLGYVSPSVTKFYAQAFLPQENLGKIDTGMEVQLRFDAYPYQEMGFVKGRLNYISKVPSDSGYMATVQLVNGLKTNLGRSIQYKSGLKANALVITQNMRLLQRLYFNIVKATSLGK